MDFPDRLKKARKNKGLSQSQLAKKMSCSVRTIQDWEQGRREPLWSAVVSLADALGISTDELRPNHLGRATKNGTH